MSELLSVKIAKVAPAGATATAVAVFADRLSKVPGVRKAALDRAGFSGKVGETLVLIGTVSEALNLFLFPFAKQAGPNPIVPHDESTP